MTKFVVGFLFNLSREHVVLLKKRSGLHEGLLNGPGGKVEARETCLEAMGREFEEETGIGTAPWDHFARIIGVDYTVDFFRSFAPYEFLRKAESKTAERVDIYEVKTILNTVNYVVPDLHWLIPMAAQSRNGFYEVRAL